MCSNSLSPRRTMFQCNLRNDYYKRFDWCTIAGSQTRHMFFFCIFLITQVSFLIQKCSTRTGLYLPAETSGTTSTTLKESM